ncbi:rod shape-determining protein RodA [Pontivivens insulae]|uniref:Peptidoglycan glycosyltransferase MrdB n=1 Tax=Pontivivens insulae TaxID=1639689 RepID=A0A2R8A7M1_9RHOB|nr:rod shape-determining protein RodA [Pontivivens insulae]RED18298.1 cell elongation-specific peptidoglycan biosynthesis regulator RodA [Pontivivens insulae]SPF28196.1 Peptidoglycan glycosyltransferase MrdB [Pontivivens insulae]
MTYYEQMNRKPLPTGPAKLLFIHWPLVLLICAVCATGFLMLYSVAGGELDRWARPQMTRFGLGLAVLFIVAVIHIDFWKKMAPLAYLGAMGLLVAVEFVGVVGMGAQRWIDIGPLRLQPSEVMKIALVMVLAAYYAWLPREKVSRPFWVLIPLILIALPTLLVLRQPDLGTSILLVAGGCVVMFLAGVSWWYWGPSIAAGVGTIWAVLASKGTDWQILKDYQYRRIETFLDPSTDPLGSGYHITQATIALGAGGVSGRGFMEGTQSRLNFLPEKHTDFIFTSLAEQFGLIGGLTLLGLYTAIVMFCLLSAFSNRNRFGALMTGGLAATFFFFFAVNMAMVMGMAPVVGVPLPLVSYGGSAMLVLLGAFGLVQSAHVHRPRGV